MKMAKEITVISCFHDAFDGAAAVNALQDACNQLGIVHHEVNFDKLDFGETSAIDTFYSADVVVADVTEISRRSSLFYHLSIRESSDCKNNIVTVVNRSESYCVERRGSEIPRDQGSDLEQVQSMVSSTSYVLVVYYINQEGKCCVWNMDRPVTTLNPGHPEKFLAKRFHSLLNDVLVLQRQQMKELFFKELCQAKKKLHDEDDEELKKELIKLQRMLDQNPTVLFHSDVVVKLLLSFRDVQDYQSMVSLVEKLPQEHEVTQNATIQYHYAYALNKRNSAGDRERALNILEKILVAPENQVPDFLCLCGKIYKDTFTDSGSKNKNFLERAIQWYRKGFVVQPNEYAGINLATLLMISGETFSENKELQQIEMTLNTLIGRKGNLESQQDYWVVATYFELNVLAEKYSRAIQAAECMFKLHPPAWYLESTVNNIRLISSFRKQKERVSTEESVYNFWLEFFIEAIKKDPNPSTQFPVLLLDDSKHLLPCYITVHDSDDDSEKSIQIWNIVPAENEAKKQPWKFLVSSVHNVVVLERDSRCILMSTIQMYGLEFNISFPSKRQRELFMEVIQLSSDPDTLAPVEVEPIQYEYLYENEERVVLDCGSFGVVYSAIDKITKKLLAVREIPEREENSRFTCHRDFQALQEEIHLYSQLQHKNIVRYYDSRSENGYFKVFMEQVPGGSLSRLLREQWGSLDEKAIKHYTRQIVRGLKYLHDNKVVHRDIKGDNILVNMHDGSVKISDFVTAERKTGLHNENMPFEETIQFMAPEVVTGECVGPPSDIWSLGCTVIEMATGKTPFYELENPYKAFAIVSRKRHPNIPSSLSPSAHDFLKKCFNPNPEERATAKDLLIHPFLAGEGEL